MTACPTGTPGGRQAAMHGASRLPHQPRATLILPVHLFFSSQRHTPIRLHPEMARILMEDGHPHKPASNRLNSSLPANFPAVELKSILESGMRRRSLTAPCDDGALPTQPI